MKFRPLAKIFKRSLLILIVDDEPDLVGVIHDCLQARGYGVAKAFDGFQALRKARRLRKPDLILLDVMMPGMDGFETLRLLKGKRATMRIPVILLTARDLPEDVREGMYEHAEKYLIKPFDLERICSEIKSSLARRGKQLKLAA